MPWPWVAAISLFVPTGGATADGSSVAHPLDPLGAEELTAAMQVLKSTGSVRESSRVHALVLHEPPKAEVLGFSPGGEIRREAFAVIYEPTSHTTYEGVIDLRDKRVVSWTRVAGVQPPYSLDDLAAAAEAVRNDAGWRQALADRGITDVENVQIDPGPAGYYGLETEAGARLSRVVSYYRQGSGTGYDRPIEGVVALVDLDRKRVVKLTDTGPVPLAEPTGRLEPSGPEPSPSLKSLEIRQPQGASFEVHGHEVSWQNWRFRYVLHPREGLVLYTVGYAGEQGLRPVLYRASLSEMVVPYADPSPAWFFRSAFDVGEYGLGRGAMTLQPVTDAPPNARFLDATLADERGQPLTVERAVAIFERDGGLLWKHRDYLTGRQEARRARELVLACIAGAANYAYGFNWVFHQDGVLEVEVLLTGMMQVKGVDASSTGVKAHAHAVAKNIAAVHHQHFFNFRLDLDVDGPDNSVVEANTESVPRGPSNPHGNAFVQKETLLRREGEARRRLDLASSRTWKVINPSKRNALGQPVGYMLVPGENAVAFATPDSWVRRRAGFLDAHLWVTPYDPRQMYAAGDYVNQSKGHDGLARWVASDRAIENRDIVLWYTLGITHIPRPEDWPVVSTHRAGFKLVPAGFFDRNPALGVPKPR